MKEMDHGGLAARRVRCGVAGGLTAATIALVEGASWSVATLCASDVAALVFVVWVWWTIARADAAQTARVARAEDASRAAAEAVLVGAAVASLLAVVFTLAQAGDAGAPARGLLTGVAIASVALAWLSVHTVYILRYARLYLQPAGRRHRFPRRAARLCRLRVPRAHGRHDVPGLRHRAHR